MSKSNKRKFTDYVDGEEYVLVIDAEALASWYHKKTFSWSYLYDTYGYTQTKEVQHFYYNNNQKSWF